MILPIVTECFEVITFKNNLIYNNFIFMNSSSTPNYCTLPALIYRIVMIDLEELHLITNLNEPILNKSKIC